MKDVSGAAPIRQATDQAGAVAAPRVSVIVVNYNAGPLLADCVASVLPDVTEVLVIDNGSKDDSLDYLRRHVGPSPALQITATGRNLGFAAACNIGIDQSRGDYLLFLNPDCRLQPGALASMLDVLARQPACAMVGPLLLNPDGSEQWGGRRNFPSLRSAFHRLFAPSRLTSGQHQASLEAENTPIPLQPVAVDAISGACMLVCRRAIRQVGPWDAGYFLHCEDLDWCMRFHQAGFQVFFAPHAIAVHTKGTCSKATPLFVEWHKHRGMLRYFRKFHQGWLGLAMLPAVCCGLALHFLLVALKSRFSRSQAADTGAGS